jgi:hypothetical protein
LGTIRVIGGAGKEYVHSCGVCHVRLSTSRPFSGKTTLPMYLEGPGANGRVDGPFIRQYEAGSSPEIDNRVENGRRYILSPIPGLPLLPMLDRPEDDDQLDKVFFLQRSDIPFKFVRGILDQQSRQIYRCQVTWSDFYNREKLNKTPGGKTDTSIFVYKSMADLGLSGAEERLVGSARTSRISWNTGITFTQEQRTVELPFPPTASARWSREFKGCYPYIEWQSPHGPLSFGRQGSKHFSVEDAYGRQLARLAEVEDEKEVKVEALLVRGDLPDVVLDELIVMYTVFTVQKARDAAFANVVEEQIREERATRAAASWNQPGAIAGGGG